jgi:hypothetical protein
MCFGEALKTQPRNYLMGYGYGVFEDNCVRMYVEGQRKS